MWKRILKSELTIGITFFVAFVVRTCVNTDFALPVWPQWTMEICELNIDSRG